MKNDEVNRRQPNLRPLAQRLPRPGRVSVFAENDDLLLLEPIRRVTYCRTGMVVSRSSLAERRNHEKRKEHHDSMDSTHIPTFAASPYRRTTRTQLRSPPSQYRRSMRENDLNDTFGLTYLGDWYTQTST
jgi:hypothetical protein